MMHSPSLNFINKDPVTVTSMWIDVNDELPPQWLMDDAFGNEVHASDTVITNKGAGVLVDDEWRIADWDVTEAGNILQNVTHWMPMPVK